MEAYTSIGVVGKPHGLGGELKFSVDEPYMDDLLQAKVVFVEIGGGKVPYFVEQIRPGNNLLVKLEDIGSREAAAPLAGKELFLRSEDVQAVEEDDPADAFYALEGFMVVDREWGPLGLIEEVLELPQQFMAAITYQGREILIPLHEQLIVGIEVEAKILEMNLPDGLLDL